MSNKLNKNRWEIIKQLNLVTLMLLFSLALLGTNSLLAQGGALSMNGSSYIEVPDAPAFRFTNEMTIEAWIYLDDNTNNTIIDKGNYSYLFDTHPNGQPALGLYSRSFGWIYSGGSVPINQWVHVAVSFKTGTNGVKFYLNGNLLSTHTALGPLASDTGPVNIGRQDPLGCQCNKFNGDIDELRIWNVARTQAQIADNMNRNTLCDNAGIAAYFPFNENSGTTVSSSVGGYVGTIINPASTTWVPGVTGSPCLPTQTLTILGGFGTQGEIDPYTEASRDGGLTWQPAYLTGWHPWGFAEGTNSWINFDPSPFVGLNTTTDYRIRFNVPSDYSDPRMTFVLKADNRAWLSINGTNLGQFDGAASGAAGDQVIAQALRAGENVITIRLQDFGGWVGLNYRIDLTMKSNEIPVLVPAPPPNRAPVAIAGTDQIINCAPTTGSQVTLNGSGSDADNDLLSYSWSNGATTASQTLTLAPGTHTLTLTVNDGKGGTSSDNVIVTIHADVTAPVPDTESLSVVTGECSAKITTIPTATDACGGTIAGTTSNPLEYTVQGTYTVKWTYTDSNGNSSEQNQTVVVKDVTVPIISSSKQLLTLWPPTHKYETVKISDFGVTVTDNCTNISASSLIITKVTSDEPEDSKGNGDGNTKDDIVIAKDFKSVDLRKEREGTGNGRVYTIYVSLSDGNGNVANSSFHVQVPHDVKDTAVNDGVAYEVLGGVAPVSASLVNSKSTEFESLRFNSTSSSITNESVPDRIGLAQNYPNPFNPTTTIRFGIPEASYVTLIVYNLVGQEVATLINNQLSAGYHSVNFDAKDLASGTYIYRIQAGNKVISYKMNFVK